MNSRSTSRSGGPRKLIILLAILLLAHIISNAVILAGDNTPLLWDGGDYFHKSLKYYDVFARPRPDFLSRFNTVSTYRPPLVMLSSLPLYFLFGRSADVAVMTNFLFFFILLFSIYGTGRILKNRQTGLLAAFVVSTFPIIFGLSRSYWMDFPLTAMVSLGVYLLLRTGGFSDRRWSVIFGVSAGLGMLTKWTWFIFLAGPFLYVLLSRSRQDGPARETAAPARYQNAALSVLAAVAVSAFWYIPNGVNVAGKLFGLAAGMSSEEATRFQQLGESIGPTGILNIRSITFYAGKLVNEQITFTYAVLFAVFTAVLLMRSRNRRSWIMFLWIVLPVIAFTLIKNKTVRNDVPVLPAIALVIASGIMEIRGPRKRRLLMAAVLIFGLLQYTATSYGARWLPGRLGLGTPIGDVVFFSRYQNTSYALFRARSGDWKADEILDTIDASRGGETGVKVVLIPRDAFTWMAMEYSSHLKGMPFEFIGAIDHPRSVLTTDFVLVKKGGFVAPWFGMENIHRSLDLMDENRDDYELIGSVTLPEEREYLPVYDVKATSPGGQSGVVFSGKLQVLDFAVFWEDNPDGVRYVIDSQVDCLEVMEDGFMVVFNVLNRKMEKLERTAVEPLPPGTACRERGRTSLSAGFTVPRGVADDLFSIEIGFYDRSRNERLSYNPEYLIYKRKKSP